MAETSHSNAAAQPLATRIMGCPVCGLVQRVGDVAPGATAECARCGAVLRAPRVHGLRRTAALSLAALILYLPANLYPILRMDLYGAHSENTIWDGCVRLFEDGQWPVAAIVFIASILIPACKLIGLFILVLTVRWKSVRWRRERTWIYRFIDAIGPWAMLDVFLLSVLVALVKLRRIATVLPGLGLLAFTAVVVLTILASASFEPRWIWEERPAA